MICVALDDFDGPDDQDFAGVSGFEECISFAKGYFGLINFDDAFQWFAIRIAIERRSFCVSSQAVL
jgi:hypothetical protein